MVLHGGYGRWVTANCDYFSCQALRSSTFTVLCWNRAIFCRLRASGVFAADVVCDLACTYQREVESQGLFYLHLVLRYTSSAWHHGNMSLSCLSLVCGCSCRAPSARERASSSGIRSTSCSTSAAVVALFFSRPRCTVLCRVPDLRSVSCSFVCRRMAGRAMAPYLVMDASLLSLLCVDERPPLRSFGCFKSDDVHVPVGFVTLACVPGLIEGSRSCPPVHILSFLRSNVVPLWLFAAHRLLMSDI